MKPSWKDAPDWANWLAMDSGGTWFWYEFMPVTHGHAWEVMNGGMVEYAPTPTDWLESLESRRND